MLKDIVPEESAMLRIDYLKVQRVVASAKCSRLEALLAHCGGQAVVNNPHESCAIAPGGWLLVDFGQEIHGGIEIVSGTFPGVPFDGDQDKGIRLHVTFGESVSEALATPDYCHAVQNMEVKVVPWSTVPCGELGFRFVRIQNVDDKEYFMQGLRARFVRRDLKRTASFQCSDAMLNDIWEIAADTLELCMQRYLVDGIKRDRLVWMGDMYPEIATCGVLYGKQPLVEESLDFIRDNTPLPGFMNGMFAYTMWWILSHGCWFKYFGDVEYLRAQQEYLRGVVTMLEGMRDEKGEPLPPNFGILDWATNYKNSDSIPGLKALYVLAMKEAASLFQVLEDGEYSAKAQALASTVGQQPLAPSASGNALQVLSGMRAAESTYQEYFQKTLPHGLSTFLGCIALDACVEAGHCQEALQHLRQFWGGMVTLGATSFWEHFDVDWLENAAPIDQIVPAGKRDVHRDCGDLCFKGLRHSFCHGWSSQPAEWLLRNILGVSFVSSTQVTFKPNLCGLEYARGSIGTPYGQIAVELQSGKEPQITLPPEIKLAE